MVNRRKRIAVAALSTITLVTLGLISCSTATPTKPTVTSSPTATRFTSTTFNHSFSLVLPTWAPAKPTSESATFATWEAPDGRLKLRFMAPVVLYTPNSLFTPNATPDPIPADYSSYLLGLVDHGVHFTDVVHRVISGHQAVVVTGTTNDPKDGSLGCPSTGLSASDCFAFQPGLVLRLADIDDNGVPVLVWLRDDAGAKNLDADVAAFDKTLGTLTLTD